MRTSLLYAVAVTLISLTQQAGAQAPAVEPSAAPAPTPKVTVDPAPAALPPAALPPAKATPATTAPAASAPAAASVDAKVNTAGPVTTKDEPEATPAADDDWRFVWKDGLWWYYMPDETWMVHQNGAWVKYDPAAMLAAQQQMQLQMQQQMYSRQNVYAQPSRGYRGYNSYYNRPRISIGIGTGGYPYGYGYPYGGYGYGNPYGYGSPYYGRYPGYYGGSPGYYGGRSGVSFGIGIY